jgi:hypothetical protein
MLYQALKPYSIILETTETRDLDAGVGLVLIPEDNAKVFLHWLNGEKLRASYTMSRATKVYDRVRLINASNRTIEIKVVDIG